jgi:hypothetical protein
MRAALPPVLLVVRLVGAGTCPNAFPRGGGAGAFNAAAQECISRLGIRQVVTYQPLSRYWPLQWCETLMFLGLAVALAGLCFWRVRRSLA